MVVLPSDPGTHNTVSRLLPCCDFYSANNRPTPTWAVFSFMGLVSCEPFIPLVWGFALVLVSHSFSFVKLNTSVLNGQKWGVFKPPQPSISKTVSKCSPDFWAVHRGGRAVPSKGAHPPSTQAPRVLFFVRFCSPCFWCCRSPSSWPRSTKKAPYILAPCLDNKKPRHVWRGVVCFYPSIVWPFSKMIFVYFPAGICSIYTAALFSVWPSLLSMSYFFNKFLIACISSLVAFIVYPL